MIRQLQYTCQAGTYARQVLDVFGSGSLKIDVHVLNILYIQIQRATSFHLHLELGLERK